MVSCFTVHKTRCCWCVSLSTPLIWRTNFLVVARRNTFCSLCHCLCSRSAGMYIVTCNILNIISNITGVGRREPMYLSAISSATLLIWMKTPTSFRIKYRHSYRNNMADPVWLASSFQMNNFQISLSALITWTFRVELVGMKSAQVVQSCPLISLHLRSTINGYDGMKLMTIRWIIFCIRPWRNYRQTAFSVPNKKCGHCLGSTWNAKHFK